MRENNIIFVKKLFSKLTESSVFDLKETKSFLDFNFNFL